MAVSIKNWRRQLLSKASQVYTSVASIIIAGWDPAGVSVMLETAIQSSSPQERSDLIDLFVQTKQHELNTVLLSTPNVVEVSAKAQQSALVASLIASLLSWNWLPTPAYFAKVAMLCALLHSLVGLGIATQQSVALSRLSLHPQRTQLVNRVVFGSDAAFTFGCDSKAKAWWRHFSWQIPTMMLGNSIVFIIVGLAIAIFSEASKAGGFGPEVKIAIAFTISLVFSVSCYLASWMCIEVRMQKAM